MCVKGARDRDTVALLTPIYHGEAGAVCRQPKEREIEGLYPVFQRSDAE